MLSWRDVALSKMKRQGVRGMDVQILVAYRGHLAETATWGKCSSRTLVAFLASPLLGWGRVARSGSVRCQGGGSDLGQRALFRCRGCPSLHHNPRPCLTPPFVSFTPPSGTVDRNSVAIKPGLKVGGCVPCVLSSCTSFGL